MEKNIKFCNKNKLIKIIGLILMCLQEGIITEFADNIHIQAHRKVPMF